jgi:hypothetical protein
MTAFDGWEAAARQALADRGVGYQEATPMIEEARAHHADSGQDPWEALGPPGDFADGVAAEQPAAQAQRDTQGRTPRDHLMAGLFAAAFLGLPVSVLGGVVAGSWTLPVTVAGLTGSLIGVLGAAATQLPGALRAAGRPRLAPWGFALLGLLVVAAATAFTELPKTRIGELPIVALLAASVAAMWLLTRERGAGSGRASVGGGEDADDGPEDAGAWFGRLRALLVGRFDVPPGRAAELVEQAREHAAATGGHPRAEFGSPAAYARELAGAEPVRQGPWWRGGTADLVMSVLITVWVVVMTVDAAASGQWWLAGLGAVVLLGLGPQTWRRVRERARRSAAV